MPSGRDWYVTSMAPTQTSPPLPPRRTSPRIYPAETFRRLAVAKRQYDPGSLATRNVGPTLSRLEGASDPRSAKLDTRCPVPLARNARQRAERTALGRRDRMTSSAPTRSVLSRCRSASGHPRPALGCRGEELESGGPCLQIPPAVRRGRMPEHRRVVD
jgi:hypothetical protein